ncbi:hypothetical protein F5X96DRAFT_133678 [Biscogniauxia mediterranea]|nr:hypothetical protein F5X96DRAFT_133678 [Biscogniauxia mediterranea]
MPSARTRAATSCSRCRSRKQKCDELKPTCSRCRRINEPCVWPATHKRGPAKGYTEALEHRLAETENILLQLLSVADNEIISQAFSADRLPPRPLWASTDASLVPSIASDSDFSLPGPNKAGLMAHWDRFPLDTPDNIRRWAEKKTMKCAIRGPALDSLDSRKRAGFNTEQLSLVPANGELDQNDASDHDQRVPTAAFDIPMASRRNESPHVNCNDETSLELAHGTVSFPEDQALAAQHDLSCARGQDGTCNQGKRTIDFSWNFRQQFLW